MSGIRVPVGARKGAFILTSDGKRARWEVSGPHFAGWEIPPDNPLPTAVTEGAEPVLVVGAIAGG